MAKIKIIRSIVDTEGKFQKDYKVQIEWEDLSFGDMRLVNSAGFYQQYPSDMPSRMHSVFNIWSELEAPRLADVHGQRFETYLHNGEVEGEGLYRKRPAGQRIYDNILAAEILMHAAPSILTREDYQPEMVENPSFARRGIIENVRWKHTRHEGIFLYVKHDGEVEDTVSSEKSKDGYATTKTHRPTSHFNEIRTYGLLSLPKESTTYNRALLLNILMGDNLALLSKEGIISLVNIMHPRRKAIVLPCYDSEENWSSGILLPKPELKTVEDAVKFRDALQEFADGHRPKLDEIGEEISEIANLVRRIKNEVYSTQSGKKAVSLIGHDLETILDAIVSELRDIPNFPQVPMVLMQG